ncbi:MAG: hypothetical protein E6R03_08240 [Hyphomicrobiaceae bacterium]|nr:MAG: hypothetical protein E6R03_08240 [Hyphomicrobiaceae bacterium]
MSIESRYAVRKQEYLVNGWVVEVITSWEAIALAMQAAKEIAEAERAGEDRVGISRQGQGK